LALAEETIDVSATTGDERVERIREPTGGRGADVVLRMANTPRSFVAGIEMLNPDPRARLSEGVVSGSVPRVGVWA